MVCALASIVFLHISPDNFHAMKSYNKEQSKSLEIYDLLNRYRSEEPFLDCAEKGLNMYILPKQYQQPLFHQLQDITPCERWIQGEGKRWIVVNPNRNDGLYSTLQKDKNWSIAIHYPENNYSIWKSSN